MRSGGWGQARAVAGVLDILETADAHVGESGLDKRLIEDHLLIHPELDCPGKVRCWLNHHLEEHPLSDGDRNCRGVRPAAELSRVRAFSGSIAGRAPRKDQRRVCPIKKETPGGIEDAVGILRTDLKQAEKVRQAEGDFRGVIIPPRHVEGSSSLRQSSDFREALHSCTAVTAGY